MTFIGNDGSVLIETLDGFNITYEGAECVGTKFEDINMHKGFTQGEVLWCSGLHSSSVDALDLKLIREANTIDSARIAAVYKLHSDKELASTLSTNIVRMTCFMPFDDDSSYGIITQAQKSLNQLQQSIAERERAIMSEVYDLDDRYFSHITNGDI